MMSPGLLLLLAVVVFAAGIFFSFSFRKPKRIATGEGASQLELEKVRIQAKDRADTRALYERLAEKKLELVKDAITMGYDDAQLARLDARLEKLVGPGQLQEMLKQFDSSTMPDADLFNPEDSGDHRSAESMDS